MENKKYHRADSQWARKIKSENLILFDSEGEAETRGFKPSRYAAAPRGGKGGGKTDKEG